MPLPVTEGKATELQGGVLNCILAVRAFNEFVEREVNTF